MQLYNGDCLDVMQGIKDNSVDCIITDPPYGMSFQSNYRKSQYKKIENDSCLDWIDEFVSLCFDKLKEDTHLYCFCSWHHIDVFKIAIEKKFTIKNILIWEKNNTGMGDLTGQYAPKYEMCIFAQKGRREIIGSRDADIIKAMRTNNDLHPTQKPVEIMEYFIRHSANEQETILDPFMGSGTTGVACRHLNRNFIGIEIDEGYFNIAKQRIEQAHETKELF